MGRLLKRRQHPAAQGQQMQLLPMQSMQPGAQTVVRTQELRALAHHGVDCLLASGHQPRS